MAGGSVGLGANAAATALANSPDASLAIVGCDPIGMTALITLKNAGIGDRLLAVEDHAARKLWLRDSLPKRSGVHRYN